ncbi:MAG: phosphoglucomutase/phosphomannomutase family protein, partial [Dehalococcoidales bacterium]|nr:phosphoglucomutase/phosphomannomutase family protein [Dehalococcoidales bacterium]
AYEAGDSRRFSLNEAKDRGLIEDSGFDMPYFAQVARLVDLQALRNAGLKIVVDPMYGAGSGYLRRVLEGGSTRVIEIHAERNPLFPGLHPEPIMPHLSGLAQAVKENRADIGLAHDGDADRMGVVDEKGNFLNQLQVFALLCLYLLEVRGERGAIVKTITTTNMAYRLGELFNVPVYETAVGFKYVAPVMAEKDAIIGGEESGGYGFRGHIPERDGILASLCFLDLVVRTGKTPSELLRYLYEKVGPHHYRRIDIKFPEEARRDIIARVGRPRSEIDGVAVDRLDTTDGFRFILRDGSWLLVRFSGTEPLLRIYTETDSPERVERLLAWGREMAGV